MTETTPARRQTPRLGREERALAMLSETPAMAVTVLAEHLDVGQPAATRMLQAMAQAGMLARLPGGAYCLPADEPAPLPSRPGLGTDARRRAIVEVIEQATVPPTVAELVDAFGVNQKTMTTDCQMLVAAGVLARDPLRGARRNLVLGPRAGGFEALEAGSRRRKQD